MANVRTVNNYSFINEDGVMVDITNKRRGRFYLRGTYTDSWKLFLGTDQCVTSSVIEVSEDGEVKTQHSVYKLGTISPEYQEFLTVVKKRMPCVTDWNIFGSKKRGYFLTGDILLERKFVTIAKIIAQNGNFLTIKRLVENPMNQFIWEDEEEVFVCWNMMCKQAEKEIRERGKVADISYSNFEKFNGSICRPNIFQK